MECPHLGSSVCIAPDSAKFPQGSPSSWCCSGECGLRCAALPARGGPAVPLSSLPGGGRAPRGRGRARGRGGGRLPRPPPAGAAPRDPLKGAAPSSRRCARGGAACRGRSGGCSPAPGPAPGYQRGAVRPGVGSGLCPGKTNVRRGGALRGRAPRSFCLPEELRARFCPGTAAEGERAAGDCRVSVFFKLV